jgi:hypothetical protein
MTAQTVEPRHPVCSVQRRRDPGLARFPCQSHPAPLCRQHRLPWLHALTRWMDDHAIIGVAHHGRSAPAWKRPVDQLFPPVPRHVRAHRGGDPAVRGARGGRRPMVLVEDARREPDCDVTAHGRRGIELASPCHVVEGINACGDVRLQHPCRCLVDRDLDGSHHLPGAPSRTTTITVRCTWCFPCRFPVVCDDALCGPIRHGRYPPRAWLVRAGLGNVDPSSWRRFPVERQGVGQGQACQWREGREAIDARCLLAPVVWRDLPYRSSCGMMGPEQALLKPADVPVITTWRGAVEALVERTHLPLNLRPADGMPWIHGAQCRAHHVCTPPRPLTFHTSGRTSAYPRALLVALAA